MLKDISSSANSLACMHSGCNSRREFSCSNHKKVSFCDYHFTLYHRDCCPVSLTSPETCQGRLTILQKSIEMAEKQVRESGVENLHPGIGQDLATFQLGLKDLKDRFKQTQRRDKFLDYEKIAEDVLLLKREVDASQMKATLQDHIWQMKLDSALPQAEDEYEVNQDKMYQYYQETKEKIHARLTKDTQKEMKEYKDKIKGEMTQFKMQSDQQMDQFKQQKEQELQQAKSDFETNLEAKYKDNIDTIEKKLDSETKETKKLSDEKDKLQEEYKKEVMKVEELKESLSKCPSQLASKLYKLVKGEDAVFNDQFKLILKLNKEEDRQLLNGLSAVPLPALKRLAIDYLPPNGDRGVSAFLSNSCPPKLKLLCLDNNDDKTIEMCKYMEGLEQVLPRVTNEVLMRYFKADKKEVETVFKLSHKWDRLCLWWFKIPEWEEYDFSLAPGQVYSISYINFTDSGLDKHNSWSSHPERLESLVAAMSKCSLKQSLKEVNVRKCKIAKEKVEKMFADRGMHVAVNDGFVDCLFD